MLRLYVLRELLPPFLAGTLLFTAILSFGYFFVSSQWLSGVPVALVGQWILYQVPDTLIKVFPMAVVLMVVVAFGRMNTERELMAAQSGGVSLSQLALPVGVVALLISLLSVYLSLWAAPRLNVEARALYWDTLTGGGLSAMTGRTLDLGNNLELHFAGYDSSSRQMQGLRVQRWDETGALLVFAERGTLEDSGLSLENYSLYRIHHARVPELAAAEGEAALRAKIQEVFPLYQRVEGADAPLELDTGLSRRQTIARYADAIGADDQSWESLQADLRAPDSAQRENALLTLHRKLSLPLGNLALALAALPFALRYGRSAGVALGVALLIAVAYYLVYAVGLALAPVLGPLALWLPNLLFVGTGLWLMRASP